MIRETPVLLNRAPTLHRLGIQAFDPILVEGKAIQLHPLVCTPFNADFDGDQMTVHVPLSIEAQVEARVLMMSVNNVLSPANGKPILLPAQDIVLGIHYLTKDDPSVQICSGIFSGVDEVRQAYDSGYIGEYAKIMVRIDGERIETTVGRVLFREIFPCGLPFFMINKPIVKDDLRLIIKYLYREFGSQDTVAVLNRLTRIGFDYATKSGISVCIDDFISPSCADMLIADIRNKEIESLNMPATDEDDEEELTEAINTTLSTQFCKETIDLIEKKTIEAYTISENGFNSLSMIVQSGARSNWGQLCHLSGIVGRVSAFLESNPQKTILSNYKKGLSPYEYFILTPGARKGLADTALKTANSGYLTRRLIDVAQDVLITEDDCGTADGIVVTSLIEGVEIIQQLEERLIGRYSVEEVMGQGGVVIVKRNHEITEDLAKAIIDAGIQSVKIRSVLTCISKFGVCAKCYGRDLSSGDYVEIGEPIGIIAAQSIGEPGTQLALKKYQKFPLDSHTKMLGDIPKIHDWAIGLPRVAELFEARKPKEHAVVSEIDGIVEHSSTQKGKCFVVVKGREMTREYVIPQGRHTCVQEGDQVKTGEVLIDGPVNPHSILDIFGPKELQRYLVDEVQKVYRLQGVSINDKHIETIVRQMMKKVRIEDSGDTVFLIGDQVDRMVFQEENARVVFEGDRPAKGKPLLLGITKASLTTDSFISAASFQETTRVLTEAAINGAIDPLRGLKENVIMGRVIPAGTGMKHYRNTFVQREQMEEANGEEES